MTDPLAFPGVTPRFGLPLLFAGQAQKEFFVNEAHALTDALLWCAIEGEAAAPPTTPLDGTAWLVAAGSTGEWSGRSGSIACRQGGNWLFCQPSAGLRILDRATGQTRIFTVAWKTPSQIAETSGGSVVDAEARGAIVQLIAALRVATVLPSS
jgi:hypothetical protein